MTGKVQAALELRRALQLFLGTMDLLTQEKEMLEVPSVFPAYEVGRAYRAKEIFRWGENSVGDPQLYEVLQDHTAAKEWAPDASPALYRPFGVSAQGDPVWVQPLGASDAYGAGDIVSFEGERYRSRIDQNVWSPAAYPDGWERLA